MWKKKWLFVIALIVVAVVVNGIVKNKPKTVKTATPTYQALTESLQLSGSVDAEEKANISYGTGLVSWVGVKEGDSVKKHQAVIKMDTRSLQKQYAQYLNNFNKQFRTHDQLLDDKNYYDPGTNVDSDLKRILENANYDLQNTVLNVEIQDLAIRNSTLSSPIEGLVTRVDKPYGGVTSTVADLIQVVNPKTIYFSAIVDETEIEHVSEGQKVTVVVDAYPEKTFTSTIDRVEFSPSTSRSGGIGYRIHIPLADGETLTKLRLGMNGTATVILSQKDRAFTIPSAAGIYRDGKTYVDVLDGKKTTRKEITVGLETDDAIEVVAGLNESDAVVIPEGN
jgi:RND family efflux transporter MFP subunit